MIREKINRTTSILVVFSVLLIAASLFALPFPFVRAVWIREIWGVTGLIHAFLFLVVSSRIGKASLPASLAGVGMVLNYEILTALGFFYIFSSRGLHVDDILFFTATLMIGVFLIWLFVDIFKSLCQRLLHKSFKTPAAHEDPTWKNYHETDSSALVVSAAGYLILFGLLYVTLSLDEIPQYGGLKMLGVLISPLSFGGIGQEIDYYFQGKQNRFFCAVKCLTHLLALLCIFWIIYRRLPLSSVAI